MMIVMTTLENIMRCVISQMLKILCTAMCIHAIKGKMLYEVGMIIEKVYTVYMIIKKGV